MEVGSFFEIYGVDNNIEKIGNIKEVTDLLNITLSRKNKTISENSRKNSLMAGFPTPALPRYLPVLLNNKFTVVPIRMRHIYTQGGGIHCATLDTVRESKLESYFD